MHKLQKEFLLKLSEPVDTTDLQLKSLENFMNVLGFVLISNWRWRVVENESRYPCVPEIISFNNACRMHNQECRRLFLYNVIKINAGRNITLPIRDYFDALDSKLVEQVKLQKSKRGVKVQNHFVKLIIKEKKI